MDFTFNLYSIVLILFGTATLLLSYYIYRKEGGAVRFFGIMMFSSAIWSFAYGFELASTTIEQAKLWISIEYIGISLLPLSWLLFCLKLSGKDHWYQNKINMFILIATAVIPILMVWTNDYHHLHFKSYHMDTTGDFPMVALEMGPSFWIFTLYFYLLLATGSYLLIITFRKSDPIYKSQNYSIIIAAFIPWITNITYFLGFRPLGQLDITPFAFIITVFLISIAIYRFKLFDILPVAREKVLELMQDGFVILDSKNRVIDYNSSFRRYLSDIKKSKIIGAQIEALFPDHKKLAALIKERQSGKIELKIENHNGSFELEAEIRTLNENQLKLNSEAVIIKLQDLTTLRKEALRSKSQTTELQQLNQLKDRVFSIIAHDLRGPLVNLGEILKMTSDDVITIEEFKTLSPTLSRDISYTTELLDNILHWSRSQLKGYGIDRDFFDLKNILVNEINYHLPAAEAKNIRIIQDVFPGEMVYADRLMIQIVVRNILNNAIKFCNENCEIHITAVYKNGFIELRIEDNGVGMSEIALQKIHNGDNISTRGTMNEKGTGLGLVICKEFMEKNDGKLIVRSELGKGSSFCIYLPVDLK
ncbi:histidine kinase N-terminal 7TM domain-containing protein [Pedobacter panaciterrae]